MLSQVLAGVVGLGSVALYLAAFFFPEVHRRHDFFWSGVGCFYALVLWFCAEQVTPTEFLGHLASVSLLGWLGWQTLTLRRKRTPLALQTPYTEDSWPAFRREVRDLTQDFLRQSPLTRWLPGVKAFAHSANASESPVGLRASSLKDVGYEFLDDLEPTEVPSPRVAAVGGSVSSNIQGTNGARSQRSSPVGSSSQRSPAVNPPVQAKKPPAKPVTLGQKGQVIVAWVRDLARSMSTPKPKKPVIEIPPRSPSIKRQTEARETSDLSFDQTAETTETQKNQDPSPPSTVAVNIVDTEATVSLDTDDQGTVRPSTEPLDNSPQPLEPEFQAVDSADEAVNDEDEPDWEP